MKTFKEYILEGKEEAQFIRQALKKELGLSNKDVSVKTKSGGLSTAVNVTIKTSKALALKKKIEDIGNSKEAYDTDIATGEILAGGNTFIFTQIDYKFQDSLYKKIQEEFDKQSGGKWEEGDSVTLFGEFRIGNQRGETYASVKGGRALEIRDIKYVGRPIMLLISELNNDSLYAKIK